MTEHPVERPAVETAAEAVALEWRERARLAVLEHEPEPRHPVDVLVVGEVADHVDRAVRVLAFARGEPRRGEAAEPAREQRGRAREHLDRFVHLGGRCHRISYTATRRRTFL